MKNIALVSIVVTTKNEESNIERCLKSIVSQDYKNIEVIVVDNNSTDKTKKISKRYGKVFNIGPERSAQRNFGMIKKSHGKYVMFIDADMILHPNLIKECVAFSEGKKANAIHIPEIIIGGSFFSRVRRFERNFYNGTVIDGARFFLKESFVKVRGFDTSMSGPEDWDIDKKIKKIGKIYLLPEIKENFNGELKEFILKNKVDPKLVAIYHNEANFNLKKYLAKKEYYTKDFSIYIHKWGKEDKDIKKQFGWKYRLFGVFIENGKWKRLLIHPILSIGMYFLRFLVGIKFLKRRKI